MAIWLFLVLFLCFVQATIIVSKIILIINLQKKVKEFIDIKKALIESLKRKKKIINSLISENRNYKKENRELKTIIKELRLKLGEKNASNNLKKTKGI